MKWNIVYAKAINSDGSLYFPEKLSMEFLEQAKRTMGSYLFANQYLNEILPDDAKCFRRTWFRYYAELPDRLNTFMFVDPALSESATSDYTGIVCVAVDPEGEWYVTYAKRHRLNPTQLISYIFELYKQFRPSVIGIEEIAYQKALLYFLDEEMRRRDVIMPIKGVRYPTQRSKETRILSLVPRFEFGHIAFKQGLTDLELELLSFPRSAHDDLIDALAGIEYIQHKPAKEKLWEKPPGPQHPEYEKWYRETKLIKQRGDNNEEGWGS